MDVRSITKAEIDGFLTRQPPLPGSFLQSSYWLGLIECAHGQAVELLGLFEGRQLVGLASAILARPRPGYTYAYLPRGPILQSWSQLEPAIRSLKEYFKPKVFWLRVEPMVIGAVEPLPSLPSAEKNLLKFAGFNRVGEIQPRATVIVDLAKSLPEILRLMHPKTRYNIKLAEHKFGLEFRWGRVE
ncbi:MAG: peptidoglycan bridge formation glycyltransferase FemA/FemB family protein, partial [Candidatus Kerfeldbacteria bacterium]|nr:peptidoglycan bridge formation glycyltransferase FemA/FemB family protein [Candidatus Kerfeldbacteria bacterium]